MFINTLKNFKNLIFNKSRTRVLDHRPDLLNQSGQATIEYILIIIVSVALLSGPLYQFNSMFRNYVDALYGDEGYFACLLETGEFENGSSNDSSSDCNTAFNTALKSSQNSSSTAAARRNSANGGKGSSLGSSGQDDGTGSSSGTDGVYSGATANGKSASNLNSKGRPKTIAIQDKHASSDSESGFGYDNNLQQDRQTASRANPTIVIQMPKKFKFDEQEERTAERREPTILAESKESVKKKNELVMDPPKIKVQLDDEKKSSGFDFSVMIKWFLILVVIVILIVVVGGQLVQLSKGGDE